VRIGIHRLIHVFRRALISSRDPHRVLNHEQHDWDDLAVLDPHWAILSRRRHKFGRWGTGEFFAEGARDVERVLDEARKLGHPLEWRSVLDFGCGLGRLAPALSSSFDAYCGVDLSAGMVNQARELHRNLSNCRFLINRDTTLEQLPDDSFDLIFTMDVLQHATDRPTILSYLRSFIRLLRADGLLVVQLPHHIPKLEHFFYDLRRHAYRGIACLGVPKQLMFRWLGLFPMTMNFVRQDSVVATLEAEQAMLLRIESRKRGVAIRDRMYYATRDVSAAPNWHRHVTSTHDDELQCC
jgi:SAM-dependent methyltransferase